MRAGAVLAVVVGSLVWWGCPSPQSLCRSGVDQVCERVHECQPEMVKASGQFQSLFGTSVNDCQQKLYANPLAPQGAQGTSCEAVVTDQLLCGNLGQPSATEFRLGEAKDCKDARAKLSCEEYLAQLADATLAPSACANRCK
jgi:hypothetical protein